MSNKSKSALIGALIGLFVPYLLLCLIDEQWYDISTFLLFGTIGALLGSVLGVVFSKKEDAPSAEIPKQVIDKGEKTIMEDLLNLKKLLDAGILTQEEYDAKKKELLDRF